MKVTVQTISECIVLWHYAYSPGSVTVTNTCLQTVFISRNWDSLAIKQWFPILASHQPLQTPCTLCPSLTSLGSSKQWNHNSSFCVWRISLTVMSSRCTQVVMWVRISFFFKADWYSITQIYRILFSLHLSVDTRAASSLAVVRNAALNTTVQTPAPVPAINAWSHTPTTGLPGSHGNSRFSFLGEVPHCSL